MSRGLWFSMNARTRRSLTLLWTALFLFSLALQSVTLATPTSVLAVHDEGVFELDGNALEQRQRRRRLGRRVRRHRRRLRIRLHDRRRRCRRQHAHRWWLQGRHRYPAVAAHQRHRPGQERHRACVRCRVHRGSRQRSPRVLRSRSLRAERCGAGRVLVPPTTPTDPRAAAAWARPTRSATSSCRSTSRTAAPTRSPACTNGPLRASTSSRAAPPVRRPARTTTGARSRTPRIATPPGRSTQSRAPTTCTSRRHFLEGGINMTDLGLDDSCFSTFLAETRSVRRPRTRRSPTSPTGPSRFAPRPTSRPRSRTTRARARVWSRSTPVSP